VCGDHRERCFARILGGAAQHIAKSTCEPCENSFDFSAMNLPSSTIFVRLSKFYTASCLFASFCHLASGAGVAALKEQSFHSDKSAKPFAFTDVKDSGTPVLNFKIGGATQNIEKAKVAGIVHLPAELPQTILNEEDIKPLRKSLDEIKSFATKFPKCEPTLHVYIESYSTYVKNFDAGMVRHESKWMTKAEFAPIKERLAAAEAAFDAKEKTAAADRAERRKAREEFVASQRKKGLEEYNGQWLPVDEVEKLVERDRINGEVAASVESKSIVDAVYSVFQVTQDGFLIEVHRGKTKQGGINSSLAYLLGADTGMAAEGDFYKGELYWCGNYSYVTQAGVARTVNSYCLAKNDAIRRIKNQSTKSGDDRNEAVEASTKPKPETGVLAGAKASGSGFFVGSEGYLITNEHVIRDAKSVKIVMNGALVEAETVKVSKVADLALLKVAQKVNGLSILEPEAKTGSDVFAIGYPQPGIQGKDVKVTKGIISGAKGLGDDEAKFQIDAAVQPGNSGGPLCDASGNLVGVVVAGLDQIAVAQMTGTLPQNVNYAIKASEVTALLRSKSISFKAVNAPAAESAVDAMKRASDCTVLVVVR
jgi:S1-C subfamily serine protease